MFLPDPPWFHLTVRCFSSAPSTVSEATSTWPAIPKGENMVGGTGDSAWPVTEASPETFLETVELFFKRQAAWMLSS